MTVECYKQCYHKSRLSFDTVKSSNGRLTLSDLLLLEYTKILNNFKSSKPLTVSLHLGLKSDSTTGLDLITTLTNRSQADFAHTIL